MNQEQIGRFIAELRKEKNITQEKLAEILEVNVKSISRWENGRTMPDLSLLPILAKELNVEISELLNGRKMTKEELLELRGTIDKLIEYNCDKQIENSKKLNKYLKIGAVCIILALLNNQFAYFNYLFTTNMAEFMTGLLYGGGICFELIGIYNNSHNISICEKKKQFIKSLKK